MEDLDKIYGYCENPYRNFKKIEKQICLDKQRAAGPDGIVGEGIDLMDVLNKNKNGTTVAVSQVNKYLWDGALRTLNDYPIKNLDFEGGFIETDWIVQNNLPKQRCLIKSHITSPDLVSNGIDIKIICEDNNDGTWFPTGQNYQNEEKQLILKILEQANQLFLENSSV